ncbi:MAG: DNA mismatch repair endonuclease MutL [Syntrophales bacterium]|nr:DNA mismatch repair endonuclease MutL [Syntrophales bacterium]
MKKPIIPMTEELAAKIAAGEVVERPSSVVKELVENAVDAGASRIEIDLEEGGIKSIRVIDDGEGIEASQVPLVFERHATSKISSFDDLCRLGTLGFRGEAMYSIAAVSRVDLLTRRREDTSGTRCVVEGGRMAAIVEAGCPPGTSVRVRDLFYAMPARKKFLKRPSTEQARCLDIVTGLAMANPSIAFQVRAKGRILINLQSTESIMDRLYLLRDKDFRGGALEIDAVREGVHIHGAISSPEISRSSSKEINWFVNGRPLRDALLNQALMAAYRGIIEPKRYPVAVLFLEVPGEEVDVNVHPSKLEVRFRQPGDIFRAVSGTLSERLSIMCEREPPVLDKSGSFSYGGSRGGLDVNESFPRYRVQSEEKRHFVPCSPQMRFLDGNKEADEGISSGRQGFFSELMYLGQVAGLYLVFSGNEIIVLLDQHAAHERIIFEKLKASREKDIVSQRLMLPDIIEFTPGSFAILMDLLPVLENIGFEIEPYGENTVSIRAVPSVLAGADMKRVILDTIDEMENTGNLSGSEEKRDKIIILMACHDAVRGSHRLNEVEVAALCSDLDLIPNARTCPHGRPLFVVIDERELERLFRRR